MIISVGYRVNSKRGVKFRQWANRILKDYLVKGYAVNERIHKELKEELAYKMVFANLRTPPNMVLGQKNFSRGSVKKRPTGERLK